MRIEPEEVLEVKRAAAFSWIEDSCAGQPLQNHQDQSNGAANTGAIDYYRGLKMGKTLSCAGCILLILWSTGRELNPRILVLQTSALATSPPVPISAALV
jgi:hypothetical protein